MTIDKPEYLRKTNQSISFNCLKKRNKSSNKEEPLCVEDVYKILMKKQEISATKLENQEETQNMNFKDLKDCGLFDLSQINAIKSCLTQEISLVQVKIFSIFS